MNQTCPVDHEAVERTADALPGPIRRAVYFGVGSASVVAGVIGILVPLWPTTCFLLLAGWCFARSSPRAERWLHENRVFGKYLRAYREDGTISPRIRFTTVVTLWVVIGISGLALLNHAWAIALLVLVATAVTVHLYSLPSPAEAPAGD